jgi:hypothetical protein
MAENVLQAVTYIAWSLIILLGTVGAREFIRIHRLSKQAAARAEHDRAPVGLVARDALKKKHPIGIIHIHGPVAVPKIRDRHRDDVDRPAQPPRLVWEKEYRSLHARTAPQNPGRDHRLFPKNYETTIFAGASEYIH